MGQPREESPRQSQAELAYAFFRLAEQTGQCFTPEELAEATGYTIKTTKIYLTKKWWWFTQKSPDGYKVYGFLNYPFEELQRALSQKAKEPPSIPSSASVITDHYWKQEPFSTSLALTITVLCMLWAFVLLFLRKRSWWLLPV